MSTTDKKYRPQIKWSATGKKYFFNGIPSNRPFINGWLLTMNIHFMKIKKLTVIISYFHKFLLLTFKWGGIKNIVWYFIIQPLKFQIEGFTLFLDFLAMLIITYPMNTTFWLFDYHCKTHVCKIKSYSFQFSSRLL